MACFGKEFEEVTDKKMIKLVTKIMSISFVGFLEAMVLVLSGGFYIPNWTKYISCKCSEYSLEWRS